MQAVLGAPLAPPRLEPPRVAVSTGSVSIAAAATTATVAQSLDFAAHFRHGLLAAKLQTLLQGLVDNGQGQRLA